MAQALLNNINIIKDNSFNSVENAAKTVGNDFAKIFDSKTTDKLNIKPKTENSQNNAVSQTIGNMKQDINKDESFTNDFNKAVQESAADTVVDLSIIKEETSDLEQDSITEETEATAENEIETQQEDTETTIITDEDPTMFKELNTLENPTVAIMLHSQVQTTVKNVVAENEVEASDDDTITLTKSNDKSLNNTNVFKQFDNTSSKKLQVSISKEEFAPKTEPSRLDRVIDEKIVKDLNVQVVNSENENSASNDLMNQQTPQEQAAKVMIQGDVKFDKLQLDAVKTAEFKPTEVSASKIIEQISKQLDGMYNNSKLNIVLNPGSLGRVNLNLVNSKEGLTAQFTVTTQDAKDILMKGLNGLKESLLSQGISIDNVSIKLEEAKDGENKNNWTEQDGSRGGNKQQGSQKQRKEQEKPFEQMMFELNNNDNV